MSVTTAKDKLSSLVDDLSTSLSTTYNVNLTDAQVTELKRVASLWLDNTATKVVTLSDNKPDYNQILLQFQNMLEHEDAWRDTLTAGAGQAVLRFVTAAIAYAVFAQERATQERFYPRLASSVYAMARSLGNRITRKTPATVPVLLSRQGADALVIPAFTAFTVGTTKFFNRQPISFGKGSIAQVEAELAQGEVFIDTYNSPGQPFVTYEVGQGDGSISEVDVYLIVDGNNYTRVTDGFFNYGPGDKVFYENTMANGNVELITGSGNYGVMPASNANIQIRYATTDGISAEVSTVELPVLCPDFTIVSGISSAPIANAGVPNSVDFYRINAPFVRSANDRCMARRDFAIKAVKDYPYLKIYDLKAIGQQEIDPTAKWAMGVYKLCPLTDVLMDDTQWLQFSTWMQGKALEGFTILRQDPVPALLDISIEIGINSTYSLDAARIAATAALNTAYGPQQGSLGRGFYRHDISSILLNSKDPALKGGINWIEVNSPTVSNIAVDWNGYLKINSLFVNTDYSTRDYSNQVST